MRMTLPVSAQVRREAAGQLKAQGSKLKAMTPTVSMPNSKFPSARQTAIVLCIVYFHDRGIIEKEIQKFMILSNEGK